jgi:hypothetical protein
MDAISPVASAGDFSRLIAAARAQGNNSQVGQEFLTLFYKEMLKQTLQSPALTFDPGKNEEETFFSAFNSDIMVDQFARELARDQSAQLGPVAVEEGTQ